MTNGQSEEYKYHGVDISFWGEDIDFEVMATNADFVFIRAGQGDWVDTYYEKNRIGLKDKVHRGAYWFYDDRIKPSRQAEKFVEVLGDDLLEGTLWCDYELDYGGAYGSWRNFYDFVRILGELLPGKEIGIYTGYYYWLEHIPAGERYLFENYPLWLAWYTEAETIPVPAPWTELTCWQYTNAGNGEDYGLDPLVKKAIDLNRYYGEFDFIEYPPIAPPVEPPVDPPPVDPPTEPPPETEVVGTVILDDLRIRDNPSTQETKILGEFWNNGSVIPIHEERYDVDGNHWVKFSAWASAKYNGQTLIEIERGEPEVPQNSRDPEYFKVPDVGVYWRTGHDHETVYWDFKPRSAKPEDGGNNLNFRQNPPDYALPETIKTLGQDDFIELTEPMQWQWFEMLVMAADGVLSFDAVGKPVVTGGYMTLAELYDAWFSVTDEARAWTDRHSRANGYTDYVLKVNMDGTKGGMQIKCLSSGGQMLEQLEDLGRNVKVRALDPEKEYNVSEVFSDPCVVNWATQSCCLRDEEGVWTGQPKSVPFPQIRQNGIKSGTPVPFYGHGGYNIIEKEGKKAKLIRVDNGDFHSPYIFVK